MNPITLNLTAGLFQLAKGRLQQGSSADVVHVANRVDQTKNNHHNTFKLASERLPYSQQTNATAAAMHRDNSREQARFMLMKPTSNSRT